jgi:hypothetical protein
MIFFEKWFIGFGTDLPVIPTGLRVLTDFNHCRPTGFGTGLPIIPIGLPILDFSNSKFEFGAVFDRFYRFSQ